MERLTSHSLPICIVCSLCFYETMSPKKQLSGQSNPSKAKREREASSLNEKMEILALLKSGISSVGVGLEVSRNESSIRTVKQKEAGICGSVSAAATRGKIVSLVPDKELAKTEKALNVWLEDKSQKHIPVDGKVMCEKALSLCEPCCEGLRRASLRGRRLVRDGWLAMQSAAASRT